ncbi:MAG: class I SAM-dependent methyltransferase [Patescibacteria group bacterium]
MITTLLIEIIVLIVIIIFLFWWITDSVAMFRAAPFVASKYEDVEKILKLSEITAGKNVLELGSGNGETCIRAAERGAMAKGIELNPFLVIFARWRAHKRGVTSKCVFTGGDFLRIPFPKETDVVVMFLLPFVMPKLWEKMKRELRPGTIVISNTFEFPNREPESRDGKILRYRL